MHSKVRRPMPMAVQCIHTVQPSRKWDR